MQFVQFYFGIFLTKVQIFTTIFIFNVYDFYITALEKNGFLNITFPEHCLKNI